MGKFLTSNGGGLGDPLAGKNNMEKEGGREKERRGSDQVLMQCSRWVWFGLVWFLALVLVLTVPGSGKVQSRAVRCGFVVACAGGK